MNIQKVFLGKILCVILKTVLGDFFGKRIVPKTIQSG